MVMAVAPTAFVCVSPDPPRRGQPRPRGISGLQPSVPAGLLQYRRQRGTIGLDLAKHWFQVHGVDANGAAAVRRKLRRSEVLSFFQSLPPCLVGIEACATAHYWARELTKLGYTVKLMPPAYVKAYVKRNKNDAADAEAICEAVRRPTTSMSSNRGMLVSP